MEGPGSGRRQREAEANVSDDGSGEQTEAPDGMGMRGLAVQVLEKLVCWAREVMGAEGGGAR